MTATYQNQDATQDFDVVLSKTLIGVLKHVYLWMCLGLFVTAGVSVALIYTPLNVILIKILEVPYLFLGLTIGEVALVWWLSARINKMPITTARIGFLGYAILNGVTTSIIFLVYTQSSIALAFVTTSALFGVMAVIGYTTKLDLSTWRSYLVMGVIGFLIGSIANYFFASSVLDWVITFFGIILFIGLTVYDTQKIKRMVAAAMLTHNEAMVKKAGLRGALSLYLDFINLFLLILRLLRGKRR